MWRNKFEIIPCFVFWTPHNFNSFKKWNRWSLSVTRSKSICWNVYGYLNRTDGTSFFTRFPKVRRFDGYERSTKNNDYSSLGQVSHLNGCVCNLQDPIIRVKSHKNERKVYLITCCDTASFKENFIESDKKAFESMFLFNCFLCVSF